jgi:phosphoribosylformylglycinamidine synthase
MDAKRPGDLVYVLGRTLPELGASEYFALHGFIGNRVPRVDAAGAKALYAALARAIRQGLVASCHDCSDGGLGVALAESAFAGALGMEVDLRRVPALEIDRDDYLLFSESASRFVATVRPENKEAFEACLTGNIFAPVGVVAAGKEFKVRGLGGEIVIRADLFDLKEAWKRPLQF